MSTTEFRAVTPVLKARDIRRTIEFYVDVLGFELDTLWPRDEPTLCILDRGPVHLMFDLAADWDDPGAEPAMTGQLNFDVADVDALYAAVRDRADILWGPETYAYGRREFSIRDCNGYRLVFGQPA